MRGNYLILTKEELNEFNKIYNFEIFNNLVIVGTNNLTESQTAQIMDIVQRKTDILPENIVITVSKVKSDD